MAELNDPQLKAHCNEYERTIANLLHKLDVLAQEAIADYVAKNLGTVIDSGGAGNLITDNSETDGRTRCTGGDVYNQQTLLADLLTFLGTNNRRDVFGKWKTIQLQ